MSLEGLNHVTTIEEDLWIHTGFIPNLLGLDSLATVGGTLHIFSNADLTTLDLDLLDYVGENFWIVKNPNLPTALVTALRDQVLSGGGIGGEIDICGNKDGFPCD
jgi:hypothetical protein